MYTITVVHHEAQQMIAEVALILFTLIILLFLIDGRHELELLEWEMIFDHILDGETSYQAGQLSETLTIHTIQPTLLVLSQHQHIEVGQLHDVTLTLFIEIGLSKEMIDVYIQYTHLQQ